MNITVKIDRVKSRAVWIARLVGDNGHMFDLATGESAAEAILHAREQAIGIRAQVAVLEEKP